jgi:pyruvate ferredoxin oxidoreductase delta subunit
MYNAARIETNKCLGCRLCILYCPEPNVIMMTDSKKVAINDSRCKSCGLCAEVCPKGAVTLRES